MYNIYYTLHAHSLYNCADIWAHLWWTITAALLWEINGGIFAFTRILCQQFAVMKYMLVLIRSLFARLDFTFCCDCYNLTTLNNNQRLETRSLFPAWSFSLNFVLHIVLVRCWPLDQSGQVNWVLRKFLHLAFSLRYWCISQGLCCFVFVLLDEWVLIFYFSWLGC